MLAKIIWQLKNERWLEYKFQETAFILQCLLMTSAIDPVLDYLEKQSKELLQLQTAVLIPGSVSECEWLKIHKIVSQLLKFTKLLAHD